MGFDLAYFWEYLPRLLKGAVLTVELSLLAIMIGFVLGNIIGLLRLSRLRLIRYPALVYVNAIRGTPLLVQLFLIYYGLPQVGLKLGPFAAALTGMALNDAAYVAEITRGAVQSIDKGQWEAARATGLSPIQGMIHVIFPQALKRMIPPLGNEFILLIKSSSLVSTIAMVELTRTAQLIASATFRPMEMLVGAALIYLAMNLVLQYILASVEGRL
ncbi:MAG: amino acid ABC transporter permease [Deltaproteobacteria bacterium]|nr:amino acid ABC transporter permease [Deltaproteobacteria bacterium]